MYYVGMNEGRKMRTIHKEEVGEGSMNIKYEQKTENEYKLFSMYDDVLISRYVLI